MSTAVEDALRSAPAWQRPALRVLFAIVRRPRGLALLRRFSPADQAIAGLLAMSVYDDPRRARGLGWDADAVVARGRALRRSEGRP